MCEFVDAEAGAEAAEYSLARDVPDVAGPVRSWMRTLPSRYPEGSSRPQLLAWAVLALIRLRAQHGDRPMSAAAQRLAASMAPVKGVRSNELEEFSRAEKRALVRAAWEDVRGIEARLQAGHQLVTQGAHPAEHGWTDPANLAWGLAHGAVTPDEIWRQLPTYREWPPELMAMFERTGVRFSPHTGRYMLTIAIAAMVFPRNIDLQPFRVLLVAATGHAPEELTGLHEDEVEFFPGGVRLRLTKRRAHQVRTREFRDPARVRAVTHADQPGLNVAEILQRLSAVTAGVRERSDAERPLLFTRASITPANSSNSARGQLRFKQFEPVGHGGDLAEWTQRVGMSITGRLDIRRLRKSTKVEKAIAFRGVVSDIADDHTAETFWGHYAHGTTLRVIAGHTVTQAQQLWLDQALNGPVVLDDLAEQQLGTRETATVLGITREQADDIRQGALDMGVTGCRDPYDSPFTPQGKLCSVAPLRCLECRNAFVLPSNLPQLLLFADHLHQLRNRLTPQHFHQLWGQSLANLQAVLADRTDAELDRARAQIADQDLRLQLPLSSFAEFDT